MTDVAAAVPAAGEALPEPAVEIDIPVHTPGSDIDKPRELARSIVDWRRKRAAAEQDKPAEGQSSADAAAPVQPEESAQAGADSQATETPGETEGAEPVDELPPIEPPGSWTKDEKERFKTYPRELQAYLSEREQERDREVRRRQNEAADKEKALDSEHQAATQARQQYESALPALLQVLQQQQAGEFADIRTMADVETLARDDWPRYALWDAQQKKIAAVREELGKVQERQTQERQSAWVEFAKKQDELFIEKAPEFADKAQAEKAQTSAVSLLTDLGFTESELASLWSGQAGISLRDHRLQLLIRDGLRFREAQQKAIQAVKKPVPPVQRPGTAQGKNASAEAEIKALEAKLERSGNWKDAAALTAAKRKLAARA